MAEFDYAAAELFALRRRLPRREPFGYKRFELAAEAIRLVIEELPRECLPVRIWKSMSRDTAARKSGGCTKAQNIRLHAAVRDHDR